MFPKVAIGVVWVAEPGILPEMRVRSARVEGYLPGVCCGDQQINKMIDAAVAAPVQGVADDEE